jgi:hypothetical protein
MVLLNNILPPFIKECQNFVLIRIYVDTMERGTKKKVVCKGLEVSTFFSEKKNKDRVEGRF